MNDLTKEKTMTERIVTDPENDVEYQAWLNRSPEQIEKHNKDIINNLKFYLESIIEYNIIPDEKDSQDLLYLMTGTTEKIIEDMHDLKYNFDYMWAGFFLDCEKTFIKKVLNIDTGNFIEKESLKNYTPETIPSKDIRFVYIAESKGIYKIGTTKDLVQRLKQFTTGNSQIEIIASLKTSFENANRIEKKLHNVYKHNNIKTEWFNLSADEVEYIIKTLRFNYHV